MQRNPEDINVLIACESSGHVREAFRRRGFNAWSCDLLHADDFSPYHFQSNVKQVLSNRWPEWDLLIAHPPCTYLSVSGLHWNKRIPGRAKETEKALDFVRWLMSTSPKYKAIENPVSCISTHIRKPDQTIQPYEFGHDASKRTCLWLENLPKLSIDPAQRFPGRWVEYKGKMVERWSNQTDSGQNRLPPSAERWKLRSETYASIADAMAEQWGTYVLNATREEESNSHVD